MSATAQSSPGRRKSSSSRAATRASPRTSAAGPRSRHLEQAVEKAFGELGARIVRGHAYDPEKKHGFIDGQARGIQIFRKIDPEAPLVVAEAVWEYTSHILAGLTKHRGPDPDARQLERRVAGPRRHAQRQRVADEGRHPVQLDLERGLRGRLRARRAPPVALRGAHRPRHEPRPGDRGSDVQRQLRRGSGARGRARRGAQARSGHHGRLRRGLHGDVQRDHPRRPDARDGPLQGEALAVDALRRDARGAGRDRAPPLRVAPEARHEVPRSAGTRPRS